MPRYLLQAMQSLLLLNFPEKMAFEETLLKSRIAV